MEASVMESNFSWRDKRADSSYLYNINTLVNIRSPWLANIQSVWIK